MVSLYTRLSEPPLKDVTLNNTLNTPMAVQADPIKMREEFHEPFKILIQLGIMGIYSISIEFSETKLLEETAQCVETSISFSREDISNQTITIVDNIVTRIKVAVPPILSHLL